MAVVIPLSSFPQILRFSAMAFLAFHLERELVERVRQAVWVIWQGVLAEAER